MYLFNFVYSLLIYYNNNNNINNLPLPVFDGIQWLSALYTS